MTAFSAAMRLIFSDRNMAAEAVWYPGNGATGTPVRAISTAPDEVQDFGNSRVVSATLNIDVRCDEMADPHKGDGIVIGTSRFMVHSAPRRDALGLVWTLGLVPIP